MKKIFFISITFFSFLNAAENAFHLTDIGKRNAVAGAICCMALTCCAKRSCMYTCFRAAIAIDNNCKDCCRLLADSLDDRKVPAPVGRAPQQQRMHRD